MSARSHPDPSVSRSWKASPPKRVEPRALPHGWVVNVQFDTLIWPSGHAITGTLVGAVWSDELPGRRLLTPPFYAESSGPGDTGRSLARGSHKCVLEPLPFRITLASAPRRESCASVGSTEVGRSAVPTSAGVFFGWFSANCNGGWAVVTGTTRRRIRVRRQSRSFGPAWPPASSVLRQPSGQRRRSVSKFPVGEAAHVLSVPSDRCFPGPDAPPVALVLACLWSTRVQSQPPVGTKNDRPAVLPQSVEVFGKVVDAETGKPVEAFITQAGKFDPKDPKNVTWGFSETRNTSGGFSATIQWNEGWTARILADGYVPQPVLSEAPPAGKDRIETVIRLKKGRTVRGRVLDHLGKPVKDASVFAVRAIGLTLAGGRAVNSFDGEEDRTVRGAKTDSEGRFRAGSQRCRGTGASGGRSGGIGRHHAGISRLEPGARRLAGAAAGGGCGSSHPPSVSHASGNPLRHPGERRGSVCVPAIVDARRRRVEGSRNRSPHPNSKSGPRRAHLASSGPLPVRAQPDDPPREHRAGTFSGSTVRRGGQ